MLHHDNLNAVSSVRDYGILSLVPFARLSVEITGLRARNPTGDLFAQRPRATRTAVWEAGKVPMVGLRTSRYNPSKVMPQMPRGEIAACLSISI